MKIFYRVWLKQFPSWKSLAQVSNADVIRAWAGLGYNRRALALRDIAREVVKSGVPQREEEWLRLRGIGPYTAAAVSILAQNKKTLPIDTNVRRVLGRLLLGKPYSSEKDDDTIRTISSDTLNETDRHADMVQVLFDLAASHCGKIPNCATCPMKTVCPVSEKFLSGQVRVPKRMTPKPHERIHDGKKYPDRIYRGRILKLVRESSSGLELAGLGKHIDPSYDGRKDKRWAEAMVNRLKNDNLVIMKKNKLYLP